MYQVRADRSGKIWINRPDLTAVKVDEHGFLLTYQGSIVIAKPNYWRLRPDLPKHFIRVGIK